MVSLMQWSEEGRRVGFGGLSLLLVPGGVCGVWKRNRGCRPRDVTAEEEVSRGSADLQPLRIFKTVSGDEGARRGERASPVFMFLDRIH